MSACDGCRWHEVTEPTSGFQLTHLCVLLNTWPFVLPETCQWRNYEMEQHRICGTCKHFLGMGDWGLACRMHYHKLPNAVTDAKDCREYETGGNARFL